VVTSSTTFNCKLEECGVWLTSHYRDDYGEEYSDKKINQLYEEIRALISRLSKMPRIYESVKNSNPDETRAHSVHDGRYLIVWEIHEKSKTVILTDFRDLKYPTDSQFAEVEFDD
jgi:hypothetical protein